MHQDLAPSYKSIIRNHIKASKRKLTLKKLASLIPIQYTFLSKVLNDETCHLSREHLYALMNHLDIPFEDRDFILLLRDYEATTHLDLKKHIKNRILTYLKKQNLEASFESGKASQTSSEMNYLFEPMAVLTHAFLMIEEYRTHPKKIAEVLGISFERLRSIIQNLASLEMIEMDTQGFKVMRVLKNRTHYPPSHPYMETHAKLMRSYCQGELSKLSMEHKKSFYLTYVSDPETQKLIELKFESFCSEVNALIKNAKDTNAYQLSMDLFEWGKN